MPRPCELGGDPHTELRSGCRACELYATRDDYNRLWGGSGLAGIPALVASQPKTVRLGDTLEAALAAVGVTKDRVAAWLGRPCGCKERQEKLNQLGDWLADGTKAAIERIIG